MGFSYFKLLKIFIWNKNIYLSTHYEILFLFSINIFSLNFRNEKLEVEKFR